MKLVYSSIFGIGVLVGFITMAEAAAPDGVGPWADSVDTFVQGLDFDGNSIIGQRSNPQAALGEAERSGSDNHFVSLGEDGELILRFENGLIGGWVNVIDGRNDDYIFEKGQVAVSSDGVTYTTLGETISDGMFNYSEELGCVSYVRITDVTQQPDNDFGNVVDGYDVDGVRLLNGISCDVPVIPFFGGPVVVALAGAGSVWGWKRFGRR